MNYIYSKKAIVTFFIVTIISSIIFQILYCKGLGEYYIIPLMYSPALGCFIANIINVIDKKEKFDLKVYFNRCGFKKCNILYILLAILIPFIYLYGPYKIYWLMYPNNYAYSGVSLILILKDCFLYTIISIFMSFFTAVGEEIGWRGFMVPALIERLGYKKTFIITSLVWCLWHFPLILFGGYMNGTNLIYNLISFVLCIFPIGVICSLLRVKSKSMIPCAFLHAAHNAYDQAVFGLLTRGDNKMYFVSETGIYTIIFAWIIMLIMLFIFRKKDKIYE